MDDGPLKTMAQAAHEAMGRMISGESIGEADLANVVRFSQHFIAMLEREGYLRPGEVLGEQVQLSFQARSGPACDTAAPTDKPQPPKPS